MIDLEQQKFSNFQDWVDHASDALTCHPDYFDTEHNKEGWTGHHFKAICFDAKGRLCRIGCDFMRANDEGSFPVYWVWPDQIPEIFLAKLSPKETKNA